MALLKTVQSGGKRWRHGVDTWDKVSTVTAIVEFILMSRSKVCLLHVAIDWTTTDKCSDGAGLEVDGVFEGTNRQSCGAEGI